MKVRLERRNKFKRYYFNKPGGDWAKEVKSQDDIEILRLSKIWRLGRPPDKNIW